VVGDRDVVILKVINKPDMSEFDDLVARARKSAKQAGKRPADVQSAIRKARSRK